MILYFVFSNNHKKAATPRIRTFCHFFLIIQRHMRGKMANLQLPTDKWVVERDTNYLRVKCAFSVKPEVRKNVVIA